MKAIVHFTFPDGSEDKFHFEGTPEKIKETAEREILARGCDPALAWMEEYEEKTFWKV